MFLLSPTLLYAAAAAATSIRRRLAILSTPETVTISDHPEYTVQGTWNIHIIIRLVEVFLHSEGFVSRQGGLNHRDSVVKVTVSVNE